MSWRRTTLIIILNLYAICALLLIFRNNIHLFLYSTIFIPYFFLLPVSCLSAWAIIKAFRIRSWKQLAICSGIAIAAGVSFCFHASDALDIFHFANKSYESTSGKIDYVGSQDQYTAIGQTVAVETESGLKYFDSYQAHYDPDMADRTVKIVYLPKTKYIISLDVLE